MKGWCAWVIVAISATLLVSFIAFDAWKLEGRTLAAAGQVGDAFAIFGLAALGVAIVSLRIQQKELSSQADGLKKQGALQQVEIETVYAQIVILWDEDRRQEEFLQRGLVPAARPPDTQRQMREARERISAAELSLRVLEDEQHRGLLRQLREVGGMLPEPLQCIGAQLTHEDVTEALNVFREVLQSRQWELARLVYQVEKRLGLTPISGDGRETDAASTGKR